MLDERGGTTFMLQKYREWIYGMGVLIIVVSFYLLVTRHDASGPIWQIRQFQLDFKIWAVITSATIILMLLVGYLTRSKK